ncbi:MAG: putative addiction module antidote protein [Nitrospirae bacterium]|nr:putative addiction module antidote protein [Nitrospirota bacterium]
MTTKSKKSYQEDLIESLKNPKEAAAYLNAAIEDGDRELLLLALRNIAEARGGISAIAKKAKLNREHLYRVLSKRGNPEIKSLVALLHAMGLELSVKVQKQVYA